MKKYIKNEIKAIVTANKGLDEIETEKILTDCINAIKNNGKIIATALGKNVPICEKFIGTLNSVGIDSCFMHTNSAIHGDLGVVKGNDVIILLSKSGETAETIYLAKLLKKRVTNNWLLTCNKNSTVSKIVGNSITFQLENEGDPWNLIPNNSTLIFLVFLQALAMAIIDKQKTPLEVFKANHPGGAIGKKLEKL